MFLLLYWRIMGTPNEDTWPGVTSLPDFKSAFPKWPPKVIKIRNYCNITSPSILFEPLLMHGCDWFLYFSQDLSSMVPNLDAGGLDLLCVSRLFPWWPSREIWEMLSQASSYSTLSLLRIFFFCRKCSA